jgi:hypothetical protein
MVSAFIVSTQYYGPYVGIGINNNFVYFRHIFSLYISRQLFPSYPASRLQCNMFNYLSTTTSLLKSIEIFVVVVVQLLVLLKFSVRSCRLEMFLIAGLFLIIYPATGYSDWGLWWFLSFPSVQSRVYYLKIRPWPLSTEIISNLSSSFTYHLIIDII